MYPACILMYPTDLVGIRQNTPEYNQDTTRHTYPHLDPSPHQDTYAGYNQDTTKYVRDTCDCDRVLRVHLVDGFFIIEGKGEHAPDPNLKRRLNSTLTFDMETRVRESMDQGGRSAGLAVALTNSKVKELKMSGKNPEHFKKPEGGLLGALKLCKSVRIQPDTPFGLVS